MIRLARLSDELKYIYFERLAIKLDSGIPEKTAEQQAEEEVQRLMSPGA